MNEILKQYGLETNEDLEVLTFTSEEDWLQLRTKGIGGSDIGAIMGINKYSSPYQVYKTKVLGYQKDLSGKLAVKKGKDLESLIRSEYVIPHFLEMDYTVKNMSHHTIVNKNYPYFRANLDGVAICNNGGHHTENFVIEIKFVSEFADVNWNGEDYCGVPASYYAQVQEYMLVTGMQRAYVCALFERDWTVRYFEIPRSVSFQAQMIKAAEHFYNVNMLGKIPPAIDAEIDKEDIMEKLPELPEDEAEYIKDDSLNDIVAEYLDAKAEEKACAKKKKDAESKLVDAYLKKHIPSSPLHKVKVTTYTSTRLDSTKLKEEKPEIYEQYVKESEALKTTIK